MTSTDAAPTRSSTRHQWRSHPAAGTALRIAVRLAPVVLATVIVIVCLRVIPSPNNLILEIARLLAIVLIGLGAAVVTSHFSQRLLPLAALLKLSLVFPDQSPSRFRMALKSGSSRRLAQEVSLAQDHGLSYDQGSAAEQILLLTTAIGEHDRRTRGHSERVRIYSRLIGEQLGLGSEDLEKLQWGALLHDLGKLSVPAHILNLPGRPNESEWQLVQQHPGAGRTLIQPVEEFLGPWAAAADGHHEKWDGSGYPAGLTGDNIPLAGRIVAVADAYEVMTATRSYKKPMAPADARHELTASAGSHFDPAVVRALLQVSVGRLRMVTGPTALLMGLPVVGPLVTAVTRIPSSVSGPAAATIGALVLAGGASMGGMVTPQEPEALAMTDVAVSGNAADNAASADNDAGADNAAGADTGESDSTPTSDSPDEDPAGESTTTTEPEAESEPAAEQDPAAEGATTTTAPPAAGTTPPTTSSTPFVAILEGNGELIVDLPASPDFSNVGPYDSDAVFFVADEGATSLGTDLEVAGQVFPAGTTLCSIYVHYSPVTEWQQITLALDVRDPILAVINGDSALDQTDFLGDAFATYLVARALEDDDIIIVEGSRLFIDAGTAPDYAETVRVLTECV